MSSIYFDNHLQLDDPGSVRHVAWSKDEETPLLAVAEGPTVRVFRDEGEEVVEALQQRSVACTSLVWHPAAKVLAAGWDDGAITFSMPESLDRSSREDREVHRESSITCITFNPAGTRCVTCDNNGVVGVWKTDNKGLLTQMCHYKKQGTHAKVVFRTMTPSLEPNLENPPFFFGGELGTIYLADDFGLCSERYKIGSPLLVLNYYHQRDMVVLITKSVILAQFTLDAEGKIAKETKLKLSCGPHPETLQGVWAGVGLLATVSNESIVRLWNLADDENYILSLQGVDVRNSLAGDKVTSVDFNPRKQVLAVGTKGGRVVQWRCATLAGTPKSEASWQVLPVVTASSGAIDWLSWGPGESLLNIRTNRSCIILHEAQLNSAVCPPYMALSTAPTQVLLYNMQLQTRAIISEGLGKGGWVKGLGLAGNYVMLWNPKQVAVYEVDSRTMTTSLSSSFKHEASPIAVAALIVQAQERTVAIATGAKIELCNIQGHVSKTIQFSAEVEGMPVCLDVNGAFLVASTSHNWIKVWNVARSTPKLVGTARKFEGPGEKAIGEIRSVKVNSDGTRISLLVDQRVVPSGAPGGNTSVKVPDNRLFVYDTDADCFVSYSAGKNRVPVSHSWECSDARLVACEVVPHAHSSGDEPQPPSPKTSLGLVTVPVEVDESHAVLTLFVRDSERILLQDSVACADKENNGVPRMPVALSVPHIYFARQLGDLGDQQPGDPNDGASVAITRTVLRDFAGLESVDADTTTALLNFSYHLACGNTDEAYKSVKGVQSSGVWESMSKMCVKTGRVDVLQKCLGQMGHARAAAALRACEAPEPEARLAIVAVHLDMPEDAEELLTRCGRFDLLNHFYQANGDWDRAIDIAKTKDRVHLKSTHYAYAQHLESIEDVQAALQHFELSGTYRTESPRLLCSLGLTEDLQAYIDHSDDNQLHRWYAQYLESKAQLEEASREYKKAGDFLSLCRVACFSKDLERAQKICEESQDPAACYHLARHLEADGRTRDAIHFFQAAGRTMHALRLAQENNLDNDVMSLALAADADPASMSQAAKYYEQRGQHSKAVVLYQKAGYQRRALELCFSARLFDALRKIADDLSADSDPEVLSRCAEFFMQHEQHDKAVYLLSMSQQYERAVELCCNHDVQITEDMAEKMTPEKNAMESARRAEILGTLAKLCRKQGSFQLACKKYTQAGDKLKAMQSLLKSGDTEKIVFFAGTARQPNIYIIAGNYLQSLAWHDDPDIMKNIINFYSKAKAYDKLAAFYDACAQVEIDEYRDYDKAAGALRESLKYMVKAVGAGGENDPQVVCLQSRIQIVDKFAVVRKIAKSDPEQMVQVCEAMLDMPEIDSAVRIGDIFAQLIEHFHEVHNYEQARMLINNMKDRGIVLSPYLDRSLLETVFGAVGLPVPEDPGAAAVAGRPAGEPDVDEQIDEDEDA